MRRKSRYLLRLLARQMRREATPGERRLWEALRGRRCLGLKFRRQAIIGGFIMDFYCPELRIAIEVDGSVHESPDAKARDQDRDTLLAARGIRVIRIRDRDVNRESITRLLTSLSLRPPSPYHGEGDRG
jgi:very-short-patch-repair endonuclease